MTDQMCLNQQTVTGVVVTCHRTRDHKGPHASKSYGTRWRDSGEVLPPPAMPGPRAYAICEADGCTLWLDHAGPHGEQIVLPLGALVTRRSSTGGAS